MLKISDNSAIKDLYALADNIRVKNLGSTVDLRGIIDFSNNCSKSCMYCGLRKSNEKIYHYRLTKDQIAEHAQKAEKSGYKSIILESGEDSFYNINDLIDIINVIKKSTNLFVILNIGERPEIEYRLLKEAGVDGYSLKHETSDPILYRQLHPDLKYSDRIKYLRSLKQLGFEAGSGIMIGLPGQTLESIANDILLFRSLDIDVIDIDPYIPHPDTPLAKKFGQAGGYFIPAIGYFNAETLIYKIIAIARIVTRKTNICISTALSSVKSDAIEQSLKSGANVIITDITDNKFKQYYEVYPDRACIDKKNNIQVKQIESIIKSLNRQ